MKEDLKADKDLKTGVAGHLILIGLPGSGKTSLGRAAALRLSMPFIDLDHDIERQNAMKISEMFERHGEEFFRDAETKALKEAVASAVPAVIATGGGAPMRHENVDAMRECGFVVFVDRPPDNIVADVEYDGSRPLLTGADALYEMASQRRPAYLAAAHAVLPNEHGEEEQVKRLADMFRGRGSLRGFAVIGSPIGHTLSPRIHTAIFQKLGVDEPYGALHIPRGELAAFTERVRTSSMRGFNVTIPHKHDIIPFLDGIEDEARLCGAVNTVVVRERKLYGYNTDMDGLLLALRHDGYKYKDAGVLIIGAGGAANGVAYKAAREGAKKIVILSRDGQKAQALADRVRAAVPAADITADKLAPDTAEEAASGSDILINATPLGMHGTAQDFDDFGFLNKLSAHALVCDLVYNPSETQLLKHGRALGLAAQNGLGMLIFQAVLADELFLGKTLDKDELFKIAKGAVQQ